jgi:GNAT superfamily N-acetyltransferase
VNRGVACRVVEAEHPEMREFLAREWPLAGVALGEAVAGMARLHDLLVAEPRRGQGLGGRLVELFCRRAADLGAARCFLRCPDTAPHRRFYERQGFTPVARLPRYYHGHDFVEYLREPLVREGPGRA